MEAQELNLVAQLGIILIAAGVFTVLSRWLKQPLILGYIVAGFVVGPHLGLFPQMGSKEVIDQWSEIGIIFMLFALGLEFSFKKLLKVGSSALIMAGTICIGMFIVGGIAGNLLGWTQMEGIFLGGLLSMSSTTIIIKSFDDMGLKKKPYATLVFGALVIEDLIAVLLMVLLSTMAVSNKFSGGEMIWNLVKLAFYIAIWFLFGIYLIPTLLKKAKPYLSDEILLILAIGMCFGMVTLASAAGFSSALGAFVMGSILSETMEGEKISKLMVSIKDLFGAIFFVSVGMMLDPAIIAQHYIPVIIIAVIAVFGILTFATTGALLSGKGLETSLHAGFSMAQLGEFGFIIASLGCSLGVMRDFIYPVIIAVSVITTFTTPYMIKAADPVIRLLNRILPEKVLNALAPAQETKKVSAAESNLWTKYLKVQGLRILIYSLVLLALGMLANNYLPKLLSLVLPSASEVVKGFIMLGVTLIVLTPLIYALAVPNSRMKSISTSLLSKKPSYKWPVLALSILRCMLCIAFITVEVVAFIPSRPLAFGLSFLSIALFVFYLVFKKDRSIVIEDRFLQNLNAREEMEKNSHPVRTYLQDTLDGYDIHIGTYSVKPGFTATGRTLKEMPFRKVTGINLLKISRAGTDIIIPDGEERILPGDELSIVGTSEQISRFVKVMDYNTQPVTPSKNQAIYAGKIVVSKESMMYGRSLSELSMRASHCMVISVMRDGVLVANPKPEFRFNEGDIVWIAGEEDSCKWYE